jgi:hypothetical protein
MTISGAAVVLAAALLLSGCLRHHGLMDVLHRGEHVTVNVYCGCNKEHKCVRQ